MNDRPCGLNDWDGKVIGHELSKPFQAWSDGGFGYMPRNAVYAGRGRFRIPQTGTAVQGPVSHHASSVQRDPVTIVGTGNSKNCKLNVTFQEGTHWEDQPQLKNGVGNIQYKGKPSYGLGFTVTGFADGGIGRIGRTPNDQNPDGEWILEQWTAAYLVEDGVVTRNDREAWMDISKDIFYKAAGNSFSYYDHPGSTKGWGIDRYNNFFIKVYRGSEYCQLEFHFIQRSVGPGYELHWYKGLAVLKL